MASVDTGDVNIHFLMLRKYHLHYLKSDGRNYQELIGIGQYLSPQLFPEQVTWYADGDLVLVPSNGASKFSSRMELTKKIAVVQRGWMQIHFYPSIRKFYRKDNVFRVLVLSKFDFEKVSELLNGFSQAFSNDIRHN